MKNIQITLDKDNKVIDWCEVGSIDNGITVEVDDDFDMESLSYSIYKDGSFVKYEPDKVKHIPSYEERISALESAMLSVISKGGQSNV